MGVIVDPATGRLVSEVGAKADIDVQVRVLVPAGSRVIDRGFGSSFLEALDGRPDAIDALPASIQAALADAPFSEFRNARVLREGSDALRVELYIHVPGEGGA